MPRFDDYVIFGDESGDHGMESIDPNYPMFVLPLCVFDKQSYACAAIPAVTALKFRHFGHDQVILHETDIRKNRGPFAMLRDPTRRDGFLEDLNERMRTVEFRIIASAIRKEQHRQRYPQPPNPYHVAMGFGLERAYLELRGLGCRDGTTHILFERRGAREDADLEAEFRRICGGANATGKKLPFELVMCDKRCNSAGLQLADLVARPIGRKILAPGQPNRAYDIIHPKFRRSPDGRVTGWGLKVFP
ncbi:DUF3800 domain-containing protein [Longimicrobium sp.]|uniref:DUF3800 domain-containing protein n=1 Tax=Longimicrobium sp. TaxID=2029185 RepID=UPI002B5791C5|nr:DUF3800 domain-containing protein [Longimicrobium sp.]HSU14014.1 DUF3800 domain-containing protein [Longimicrobium sp.]